MFTGVNSGCMVEMEPTPAKFKIWGQHEIPELAGVNLGRGSNSGLNIHIYCCHFIYITYCCDFYCCCYHWFLLFIISYALSLVWVNHGGNDNNGSGG